MKSEDERIFQAFNSLWVQTDQYYRFLNLTMLRSISIQFLTKALVGPNFVELWDKLGMYTIYNPT